MSIAQKILGNTFIQVFGKIATAGMAVIIVKILAVYLGKGGYGDYATIYEYLAFFGAIADCGLFTIAVREMSGAKNQNEIFANTISIRTITTTIAMVLAGVSAFLIPQYMGTYIPHAVAIAAIATWFVLLSGTASIVLQTKLKMQFQAWGLILGKIVILALIVFITQYSHPMASEGSFYLLIWAGVAGNIVTFLFIAWAANRLAPVRLRFKPQLAKNLFKEAWPFGLALILNTIYFRLDIILFSLILPHSVDGVCQAKFCSDTEAGNYAVAVRILEVLIIIPLFFMNSVLPILSRHIKEKSKMIRKILNYSFYFLLAGASAAAIGIFILAKQTVSLISTDDFLSQNGMYGADTALKILMIAMFFTYLTTFIGFIIIAFGEQKKLMWINLIAVLFNLISNLYVIPRYGLLGAGTTSVISEALILIMGFVVLRQITKEFNPQIKTSLKIVLSALAMGLFTYYTAGFLPLVFNVLASAVLFFLLLIITRTFSKNMLSILLKKN